MEVVQLVYYLLVLFVVVSKANTNVCYAGQEPDHDSKLPQYRWFLAEEKTANCMEFQIGGLNTRIHPRPYGVTIDGTRGLQNLKRVATNMARISEDSSTESTFVQNTGHCAIIRTESHEGIAYPEQGKLSSRLERLEFKVRSAGFVILRLRDEEGKNVYGIGLNDDHSKSWIFHVGLKGRVSTVTSFGSNGRYWVTHTSDEIQVGQDGHVAPLMHYRAVNPTSAIWSIEMGSTNPSEWWLYTPCD